jgi:hypothetical protein
VRRNKSLIVLLVFGKLLPEILRFKKSCKSVSRILYPAERDHYHLSAMAVASHLYLPTLDHQASSPQAVLYMAFQHARFTRYCRYQQQPWALTPHFHPYCVCANTNTAVIFCGTFSSRQPFDKLRVTKVLLLAGYVALRCPDFPTSAKAEVDSATCSNAKIKPPSDFAR